MVNSGLGGRLPLTIMFVQTSPADPTSDMPSDNCFCWLPSGEVIGRHRGFVGRAEGQLDRLALSTFTALYAPVAWAVTSVV